ncbi:MAG: hypothetical protein ACJ72N_13995 [Labedaea sp.]
MDTARNTGKVTIVGTANGFEAKPISYYESKRSGAIILMFIALAGGVFIAIFVSSSLWVNILATVDTGTAFLGALTAYLAVREKWRSHQQRRNP